MDTREISALRKCSGCLTQMLGRHTYFLIAEVNESTGTNVRSGNAKLQKVFSTSTRHCPGFNPRLIRQM